MNVGEFGLPSSWCDRQDRIPLKSPTKNGPFAPYLTLIDAQSPQRNYDVRLMCNALRNIVRAGAPWR